MTWGTYTIDVLKHIVFLTSRFPYPLDQGDKLRAYHHIIALSRQMKVTLITLHEEDISKEGFKAITPYCHQIYSFKYTRVWRRLDALKGFVQGLPLQVAYFYSKPIQMRIHRILDRIEPDHIHCHLVRMSPYISDYEGCTKSLDYMDSLILNDMAHQHLKSKAFGWLRSLEKKRIAAYEKAIHSFFDAHFVISERDRLHLSKENQKDIFLLSNGVDTSEYRPDPGIEKEWDLCFCGNLGYDPNHQAVEFILSKIAGEFPGLSIVIAGARASHGLLQRANRQVKILSPVADMADIYRRSKIQIAPIWEGSGQQNKILEALSVGVPCITTSFVNRSIEAVDGKSIIIEDTQQGFIQSIKMLLSQPETLNRISLEGRAFVKQKFDWEVNTSILIEVIDKISQ